MDIKAALFIELYPNLCVREVILPEETEQEEKVFMEINSMMKILY